MGVKYISRNNENKCQQNIRVQNTQCRIKLMDKFEILEQNMGNEKLLEIKNRIERDKTVRIVAVKNVAREILLQINKYASICWTSTN